ncbi:hypothetical protein GCM10007094_08980 [Pseudovibrio japonicus]|uniref:Uncharacterized protein n=1 Tax=Pseudovibrio japonicus TaxID=366534 RepID=A0ABQ3E160_9HYPH|nr:hypothetical protein GCM10007094_08980 [Pseudovibrio japonicus]
MCAGDVSDAFNQSVQHLMHWMATFLGVEGMRAGQAKITHGALPCWTLTISRILIFEEPRLDWSSSEKQKD